MKKSTAWFNVVSILLLAILVVGAFQFFQKKGTIPVTPSFDGGNTQYVYQKNTILTVDPRDGYGETVKMQFFIGNVANSKEIEFYSLSAKQGFKSTSFNGEILTITDTPTGNPNSGTQIEVSLHGVIVELKDASVFRSPMLSSDGTLQARAEYTPNPKPADGEMIEFFKDLVIEKVSDHSLVARYTTDSVERSSAFFSPLTFSPNNTGIYYIDYPSAPQEGAAPYEVVYQPFVGQRKVVFSNVSTTNPISTTFGILGFYPEQQQVLTWQQVGAYDATGTQQIVRYDIPTKTFHRIDIPCEASKQYANPPSLDVRCITASNEVIVYDLMTGVIKSRSKSISTDSNASVIAFSPDNSLLEFNVISTKHDVTNVNDNSINGVESQMNVTSDYFYDIKNGVSKKLFTSEQSVVSQRVGEVTYRFLGFIK